jgi:hypothetical protein
MISLAMHAKSDDQIRRCSMSENKDADPPRYECMKHKIHVDTAECRDPDLYCKFRPSCLIHFLEKENTRARSRRVG